MAVSKRKWRKKEVWTVDFRMFGERYRERSPVNTEKGAKAYERQRRREIRLEAEAAVKESKDAPESMEAGAKVVSVEVAQPQVEAPAAPLFKDFADEFMKNQAPNTSGPREMEAKKAILNRHLQPQFGATQLDQIKLRQVNELIGAMRALPRSPKTINNTLTVLKTILRYAHEIEVLAAVPPIKLLKVPAQDFDFLDFDEMAVMREAIRSDRDLYVAVLLGAEAGLRAGEIAGLKWQDINFKLNRLRVLRQLQNGKDQPPKWNSIRTIPLTSRLATALKVHRHLQGEYVLMTTRTARGRLLTTPWFKEVLRWRGRRAYRLACLPQPAKPWHCLRHTFCSHLAMRGVPAKAIQELAGHRGLTTTMRYMHMSPSALQGAISQLDQPAPWAATEGG